MLFAWTVLANNLFVNFLYSKGRVRYSSLPVRLFCIHQFVAKISFHNSIFPKRHYPPAIFDFFHKKGTARQPFLTFYKKALLVSHFSLFPQKKALPTTHFPQKRHYLPAIFHFFQIGNTSHPFVSFHKNKKSNVIYPSSKSVIEFHKPGVWNPRRRSTPAEGRTDMKVKIVQAHTCTDKCTVPLMEEVATTQFRPRSFVS